MSTARVTLSPDTTNIQRGINVLQRIALDQKHICVQPFRKPTAIVELEPFGNQAGSGPQCFLRCHPDFLDEHIQFMMDRETPSGAHSRPCSITATVLC